MQHPFIPPVYSARAPWKHCTKLLDTMMSNLQLLASKTIQEEDRKRIIYKMIRRHSRENKWHIQMLKASKMIVFSWNYSGFISSRA